ncbi:uncharacterized protein N7529_010639 [Penicillium soppii]|uniref:uncharacterized protein n=1 Tax=Penicillium soppii TaxID=69789 RepID=UPI00254949DF|nr:uncharacterized protein N7529_010639 [Penicillium soppii]KAJ5851254.1 hypothetical protein N7529_010639 [Penicillium soppii]
MGLLRFVQGCAGVEKEKSCRLSTRSSRPRAGLIPSRGVDYQKKQEKQEKPARTMDNEFD